MLFLRTLKSLQKEKSLAKIDFDDGETAIGFVTYSDEETFDMHRMDTIFNEVIVDEDFKGGIMLEREEDLDAIDILFTKSTYQTMMISNITHDISHKFEVQKTVYFNIVRDEIYKPKKAKKEVTKKSANKAKKKITNKKNKDKDKDNIGEIS